jgi:hypothetical protein
MTPGFTRYAFAPAARAAAPAPAPARTPRDNVGRPAILVEYAAAQPCAHQSYHGATPVQAIRAVAERLRLRPCHLGFVADPLDGVRVLDRRDRVRLASICAGLTVEGARAARDAATAGALR